MAFCTNSTPIHVFRKRHYSKMNILNIFCPYDTLIYFYTQLYTNDSPFLLHLTKKYEKKETNCTK